MESGAGLVAGIRDLAEKPVGSPVKVKADPSLVADVSVCLSANGPRFSPNISESFPNEVLDLDTVLPDVLSDDEDGEVFDRTVATLLIGMNMQQYLHHFKEADVGLNMFLCLSEEDLEVIGVNNKNDRKEIAHGIANIKRRKTDDKFGSRTLTGDVSDISLSVQDVLPIMCHTVKHINNLVILLRNYRVRMDSGSMRNSLIDTQHCAALGVKILAQEALVQADLLKVQLNGMLLKLEPARPHKDVSRSKQFKNKKLQEQKVMLGVLMISSLTFAITLALALQKR